MNFLSDPGARFRAILAAMVAGITMTASLCAVDFVTQIEPVLREHCSRCHGPETQKGRFRVDLRSTLIRGGESGEPAIQIGDPERSHLVKLVTGENPGEVMPPKGKRLGQDEIQLIKKWIREGAETPSGYGEADEQPALTHWSFQPVARPELDPGDGIDRLAGRRLAASGLKPSPEAPRVKLVRRLFLVMHGLPPTPEQVEDFVEDESPDAWERLIGRVLDSPRYGERWATHWLDLVRFGETHGFETNRERPNAWRYRDWVIESLNSDKPYDQFVREQLAGDALGADLGTGFLVAGPYDQVKGRDPKLRLTQRMNELDDMINTTGTAFLGLTLGCARCHNHMFDPVTQSDYYGLQAVFAGVQHADRNLAVTAGARGELERLDARINRLEKELEPFVAAPSGASVVLGLDQMRPASPSNGRVDLKDGLTPEIGGAYWWWKNRAGREIVGYHPGLSGRYRIWLSWGGGYRTHSTDARFVLKDREQKKEIARVNQQLRADGSGPVRQQPFWSGLHDAGVHELTRDAVISVVGGEKGNAVTASTLVLEPVLRDGESSTVFALRPPVDARGNVETFVPRPARWVRFTVTATSRSQPCLDELEIFAGGTNVALAASGAKASSSGDFEHPLHRLAHVNDGRHGNARSWIARDVSGWVQIELPQVTTIDRIEWARDREGKYNDRLATGYRIETAVSPGQWEPLAGSADRLREGRSPQSDPRYQFAGHPEAEKGRAWLAELRSARERRGELMKTPAAYVGRFEQPGPTHRLYRGEPDQRREEVAPSAIASLTPLRLERDAPEQQRRLALAKWIADRENPLTARVIVNRLWQFHFGEGLVATPSDFGANGVEPTHPRLLDWLAAELMDHDWSLKHVHRLILRSATWKQDSRPDAEAMKVDAASRLLWRFPPRRLEAEGIRDAMLQVSGVLDLTPGGPGFSAFEVEAENVRHYHPKQSYGPGDWRRMIYMTKVRQEKDSTFGAFDCPDASQVVPKRSRSTTPLQALNLLNSRFVLQQAGLLAGRLEKEAGPSRQRQVERAYQLCFGRGPDRAETADALDLITIAGLEQFARALLNANEFVFVP